MDQPQKKKGKLPVSHRYNLLPLLPSGPDGVQRELVVRDLPFRRHSTKPLQGGSNKKLEDPSKVSFMFMHATGNNTYSTKASF